MHQILRPWAWFAIMLIAVAPGCRHKTDAKQELEKAAGVLAKAEPEPAPPPPPAEPAPADPTGGATVPQNAPAEEAPATPATPPAQQMQQAIVAYKAGQLEDAVTRLQKLRTTATLTAQQRMAVQDSVAAVMTEIYSLAEKGDTRAIQAVKQYEQMQTSRVH